MIGNVGRYELMIDIDDIGIQVGACMRHSGDVDHAW